MRGSDALTGRPIAGDDHLRQSVADILLTPIGSRVMRRDYGSLLTEILDQPWNAVTRLRLYAATAMALLRWEPRLTLSRVEVHPVEDQPGAFDMTLHARRADDFGRSSLTRLTLPLRARPVPGA